MNYIYTLYIVDKGKGAGAAGSREEAGVSLMDSFIHTQRELKHVGSSHSDFIASNF